MQDERRTLDVTQEGMAEAGAFARTLDETGDVATTNEPSPLDTTPRLGTAW